MGWRTGWAGLGFLRTLLSEVTNIYTKRHLFNRSSALFCILTALCFCLQSPPKGATIPYRPKPASAPIIFAGGQVRADTILASAGNHTVLAQPQPAPVSFQLLLFLAWYSIDVLCLLCVLAVCRTREHCIANFTQNCDNLVFYQDLTLTSLIKKSFPFCKLRGVQIRSSLSGPSLLIVVIGVFFINFQLHMQ